MQAMYLEWQSAFKSGRTKLDWPRWFAMRELTGRLAEAENIATFDRMYSELAKDAEEWLENEIAFSNVH